MSLRGNATYALVTGRSNFGDAPMFSYMFTNLGMTSPLYLTVRLLGSIPSSSGMTIRVMAGDNTTVSVNCMPPPSNKKSGCTYEWVCASGFEVTSLRRLPFGGSVLVTAVADISHLSGAMNLCAFDGVFNVVFSIEYEMTNRQALPPKAPPAAAKEGLSTAAIVGIVIGVVVLLGGVGAFVYVFFSRDDKISITLQLKKIFPIGGEDDDDD